MNLQEAITNLQNNPGHFAVETRDNADPQYWVQTSVSHAEKSAADLVKESTEIILDAVASGTLSY